MPKYPLSLDARKQGGRIATSLDLALSKISHLLYITRTYTYVNRIYELIDLIGYPYMTFKRLMTEIAYRSVHKFLAPHV